MDPRTLGLDPKALGGYEDAMRELCRKRMLPGCASVVFYRGQIVQAGCFGYADLERRVPFSFDSICRHYCGTKSLVTVAFGTLVDEGRASFEDRLDKFLPEFGDMQVQVDPSGATVSAKRPILIKHLLSHTAGLGYFQEEDVGEDKLAQGYQTLQQDVVAGRVKDLALFVKRLAKLPLEFEPGANYSYGFGFDVAGRVLEKIVGKELEAVLRERVCDPLGMNDTSFFVPKEKLERLAAAYCGRETWKIIQAENKGKTPVRSGLGLYRFDGFQPKESLWAKGRHCPVLSGGGAMGSHFSGLVTTVADTVKFVEMLMGNGISRGVRILQPRTLKAMETNRLKSAWGQGKVCYIGNIGVYRDGGTEVGMGGQACTYWSLDRTEQVATVWFTQHTDMPELEKKALRGIDPKKADLWQLMHRQVERAEQLGRGVKRPAAAATGQSKRART